MLGIVVKVVKMGDGVNRPPGNGVGCDVFDPFAVQPDLSPVSQTLPIFFPCA
jgi:hypothetical protein